MTRTEEPEQQPQSGQQPPEEAESEERAGEDSSGEDSSDGSSDDGSLSPEDFENDPAYNPGDETLKDIKGG
jgi:hypothetical protein